MARTYGRALPEERVYEAKRTRPRQSEKYTWISALSSNKLFAHFELNGSMTGEAFLVYVQEILIPELEPNQIVLMDNLACHKMDSIAQAFKKAGQNILFLPPYSPDFSPIEECWSKFKATLKKSAARTIESFQQATDDALKSITQQDIQGWFRHFQRNIRNLC
jgi:transposase